MEVVRCIVRTIRGLTDSLFRDAHPKAYLKIYALIWAHQMARYSTWAMVNYLTGKRGFSIFEAAGTVNTWMGLAEIAPILFAFLADTVTGKHKMILLSSFSYTIGLWLLYLSTLSTFDKTCRDDEKQCININIDNKCTDDKKQCIGISSTQKILYYPGLAMIAIGIGGHLASVRIFLVQNTDGYHAGKIFKTIKETTYKWILHPVLASIIPIIGGILLPFTSWPTRFLVPAVCTTLATLVFMSGSRSYKDHGAPQGSPLTIVLRVFVASFRNMSKQLPADTNQLYEKDELFNTNPKWSHTRSLRCLDKAAIISPERTRQEQESSKWSLCTVTEVEVTKGCIRIIPICITFIIVKVLISVSPTFFLEQANQMDNKLGFIRIPIPIFLAFYELVKAGTSSSLFKCVHRGNLGGIVFSVLAIITAAKVEALRYGRVKEARDKQKEIDTLTVLWLIPQYFLMGCADGFFIASIARFFAKKAPTLMSEYKFTFAQCVMGFGNLSSFLFAAIVGTISASVGKSKKSWFQKSLNDLDSHLDKYYWTLAALGAMNLIFHNFVAFCLRNLSNEAERRAEEPPQPLEDYVKGVIDCGKQCARTCCCPCRYCFDFARRCFCSCFKS